MAYTYAPKKRAQQPRPAPAPEAAGPSLDALKQGLAAPTREQLGRQVDLPGAIRAKMEASFGADLSAVKLYESQTVADAGAQAVAQGSRVAFAPGVLDLTSQSGQALLGHELSHVVSQARGEVSGGGLVRDQALEARADREGTLAAAGAQICAGPVTAPLSSSAAAPAAAPMQAKKGKDKAYANQLQNMARWSSRAHTAQTSEEEQRDLDANLTAMLEQGGVGKFAQEYTKQRIEAARRLMAARQKSIAQFGPERGELEAKYSKESDEFNDYQELQKRLSFLCDEYGMPSTKGDAAYTATTRADQMLAQSPKKSDQKNHQLLQDATQFLTLDMSPVREEYPSGPLGFDERKKELELESAVRRISGYNAHVPVKLQLPGETPPGAKNFASSQNFALDQMVRNATPQQLQDPKLQEMVLGSFNGAMSSRLAQYNSSTRENAAANLFRPNQAVGELRTYNSVLSRLAAPHMGPIQALAGQEGAAEEGMELASAMVESDPSLQRMLAGAKGAFQGSTLFADDESQSELLMNNFMLRAIAPQVATPAGTQATAAHLKLSKDLQLAANRNMADTLAASGAQPQPKAKGFLGMARRLWERRRQS